MSWSARPLPPRTVMSGGYCRLEPFSVEAHAADLHAAFAEDGENDLWRFRDVGPFADEQALRAFAQATMTSD
ncbi:MAG: GNAT family N-acetyltransferase, partial [Hyphomicrobiales bacterium]|nr:GNAT family N-acetyltransferase [Hyphomicrobiales bacterium]